MWKWTLLKYACVPASFLSLILLLYSCVKLARTEETHPANVSSGIPGVEVVAAEPTQVRQMRDWALGLGVVSGLVLAASLGMFGFALWRQRSARS